MHFFLVGFLVVVASSVNAYGPPWGIQGPVPNFGGPNFPQQYGPPQGGVMYQNRGPLFVPQSNQNGPYPGAGGPFNFDFANVYRPSLNNNNNGQQFPNFNAGGPHQAGGPQQPGSPQQPGGPQMSSGPFPNYPGNVNQQGTNFPGSLSPPNPTNFAGDQAPPAPATGTSSVGGDAAQATPVSTNIPNSVPGSTDQDSNSVFAKTA